jgi:ATP-dependent DNA helicase RecQ
MQATTVTNGKDPAEVLKKIWGFDDFLPLQQEAIECSLENRDALVVLPTGNRSAFRSRP